MGRVNEPASTTQTRGREIISRELSRDTNPREIARLLGRHHSTIYDEIDRNGGKADYRAVNAQNRADANRARPKERKLETSPQLHDAVNDGLKQNWSPELIGDVAWSNEGLFALLQGLRRLSQISGSRVNLPTIEWEIR